MRSLTAVQLFLASPNALLLATISLVVLKTPIPIMAIDDRPIVFGLITQDVFANISVGSHSETRPLAVVSVGYPIILGFDWLRQYNPDIVWLDMTLSPDCCGLTRASPATITARGFSHGHSVSRDPSFLATTSVGLGSGLSITSLTPPTSLTPSPSSADTPCAYSPLLTLPPLKHVMGSGPTMPTFTFGNSSMPLDIKSIG